MIPPTAEERRWAVHSPRSSPESRLAGAPGGQITSTNPARTSEVVAEVALGDAGTFAAACRAARAAQPAWADVPAPVRGRAIAHIGRVVEANARGAGPADHARDRQALPPRRSARCARSSTRATSSSARAAACTARRCRARCPTSSCSRSAIRSGSSRVITAGNFPVAVPSWYLVPALLCGNAVVWKPADYAPACGAALFDLLTRGGGLPDGVLNLVHADGAATYAGLEQSAAGRERRQDRLHRLQPGRRPDRRAGRPAPSVGVPGARRQEPDGRHAERRPGPRRGGRAVRRIRHRRAAVHVARHGDRARERARRVPGPASTPRRGRRSSATRSATCCTGRCWTRSSPTGSRSTSAGSSRITWCSARPRSAGSREPARGQGFAGRSGGRPVLPPGHRRRRAARRCDLPQRDVRPDGRRHDVRRPGRGDPAGQPARLRPVLLDLHQPGRRGVRVPPRHHRPAW